MNLKYLGQKKELSVSRDFFIGGPYVFEGPGAVAVVEDADAAWFLDANSRSFMEVKEAPTPPKKKEVAPEKPAEVYPCPKCDKVYKRRSDLSRHLNNVHS